MRPLVRLWRWVRWPFGVAIGLGLCWLLVQEIDVGDVWAHLAGIRWPWAGAGLLCIAGTILAKAARWRSLFRSRQPIDFRHLVGAILVGQMVNTAIPVRMGEVARVSSIGGARPASSYVFSTIVVEKLLDGILLGLLALVTLLLAPLPELLRKSAWLGMVISLVLLSGWLVFAVLRGERLWQRLHGGRFDWLARHGTESLVAVRQLLHGGVLLRLVGWSAVAYGLGALANYACWQALGLNINWTAALAVLVIGQFGSAVPTAPGRIGVFQGLCVAALAPYGVEREAGISFGILLYVIVVLIPSLCGVAYLLSLRSRWMPLKRVRPSSESNA